ncbi:MAG: YeeE/YedE family protein [Alphaproteobacteria bacterium]|nr:YeeE/YedE family protein [Alphaproteobacteria bacterium]
MIANGSENLIFLAGFAGGLILGWVALRANFCVMGGITDILLMGDGRRFRAWLLAIAIAVLGAEGLRLLGFVRLEGTPYLSPSFGWLAACIGGLLFGFGMTLAGGCVQRSLVRLGAGSPKALLVVAMIALFSYLTAQGPLLVVRQFLSGFAHILADRPDQDVASLLAPILHVPAPSLRTGIALLLGLALLWACLRNKNFRASPRDWRAGAAFGIAVCLGWLVTSNAGSSPDSFNFVAPFGELAPSFGAAGVLGLVFGAFLAVAFPWRVRIEWFADTTDAIHHAAGGALMGIGGTLALGCTIGQGVTGVSTLAFGSIVAWVAILGGAVLGLRYLEAREA